MFHLGIEERLYQFSCHIQWNLHRFILFRRLLSHVQTFPPWTFLFRWFFLSSIFHLHDTFHLWFLLHNNRCFCRWFCLSHIHHLRSGLLVYLRWRRRFFLFRVICLVRWFSRSNLIRRSRWFWFSWLPWIVQSFLIIIYLVNKLLMFLRFWLSGFQ